MFAGSSWKTLSDEETCRERMPFLGASPPNSPLDPPSEMPKYLELLHDSDCTVDSEGYEIPINRSVKEEQLTQPATNQSHNTQFEKVISDLTNIESLLKDDKDNSAS